MKLKGIIVSELRERQIPYDLSFIIWNHKHPTNQVHRCREQIAGCQRLGGGRWAKKVNVVKRYELPLIRCISPGVVMYRMVTIVNNTVLCIESC